MPKYTDIQLAPRERAARFVGKSGRGRSPRPAGEGLPLLCVCNWAVVGSPPEQGTPHPFGRPRFVDGSSPPRPRGFFLGAGFVGGGVGALPPTSSGCLPSPCGGADAPPAGAAAAALAGGPSATPDGLAVRSGPGGLALGALAAAATASLAVPSGLGAGVVAPAVSVVARSDAAVSVGAGRSVTSRLRGAARGTSSAARPQQGAESPCQRGHPAGRPRAWPAAGGA